MLSLSAFPTPWEQQMDKAAKWWVVDGTEWRREATTEICGVYGQDVKKEEVCTRPTKVHKGHLT